MEENIAFIDGQNLHMGTLCSDTPWKVDFKRFRRFLLEKYKVSRVYFYMGFWQEENKKLYKEIQSAEYILQFRKHSALMKGKKKGNVDADIIFDCMKILYKKKEFKKIILVSGDGDFKALVDFLIEENRFEKILFPTWKFASSLYKKMSHKYYVNLDVNSTKIKICKKKMRRGH